MAQCGVCVSRLYKSVIEDVISGVRESFLDEGIDEQVLADLKQQWEAKLAATKAAEHSEVTQQQQQQSLQHTNTAPSANNSATNTTQNAQANQTSAPVQSMALVPVQITVPSQQAGGVEKTITIHVPFSALSSGVVGSQLQEILSSPAAAQTFSLQASQAAEIIQRQLNTALQHQGVALPPSLLQYNNPVTQVDGPSDLQPSLDAFQHNSKWSLFPLVDFKESNSKGEVNVFVPAAVCDQLLLKRLISSQVDGACALGDSSDEISDDDDDDDDEDDDKDDKKTKDEDDDDEEEEEAWNDDPLNSEDDVTDDDEGADMFETENVIVCQYDKVTRVRNKWKLQLKDGIMNLKGKDYVFTKATGEAEW